jgi:hypothetical protein
MTFFKKLFRKNKTQHNTKLNINDILLENVKEKGIVHLINIYSFEPDWKKKLKFINKKIKKTKIYKKLCNIYPITSLITCISTTIGLFFLNWLLALSVAVLLIVIFILILKDVQSIYTELEIDLEELEEIKKNILNENKPE